jgi:hypothetical protein
MLGLLTDPENGGQMILHLKIIAPERKEVTGGWGN